MRASKRSLVRGIDEIPPNWEFVSAWRSMQGLRRSITTLIRLIDTAAAAGDIALARNLRRVRTAAERSLLDLGGGFRVKEIEPLARKFTKMRKRVEGKIEGEIKAAREARKPRLAVDNTREAP